MGDFQLSPRARPRLDWQPVAANEELLAADTSAEDEGAGATDDSADDHPAPAPRKKTVEAPENGNVVATAVGSIPVVLQLGNVAVSFFTRGTSEATGPRLNLPLIPLRSFNPLGHYPKLTMNKGQANLVGVSEMGIALLEDVFVSLDYFKPMQLDTAGGLGLAFTAARDLINTLELNKSTAANIANLNVFSSTPAWNAVFRIAALVDGAFKLIYFPQVAARQYRASDYGCTPYQARNGCSDEDLRDAGNLTGSIVEGYFGTEENDQNDALPDVDGLPSTLLGVKEATVGVANSGTILAAMEMSESLKNPDGRPGPQALVAPVPFVASLVIRGIQAQKQGEKLEPQEVANDFVLFAAGTAVSLATRDPRVKIANLSNASYFAWGPTWPKVLGLVDSHSGFFGEGQYDNPNSIFNLTPVAVGSIYAINSFYAGAEAGYALSLDPTRFENWIPTILGGAGLAGQWISFAQNPNEKVASTLALGTGVYLGSALASLGLARLVMDTRGLSDAKFAFLRIKPRGKKSKIEIAPNLGISPEGAFVGLGGRF